MQKCPYKPGAEVVQETEHILLKIIIYFGLDIISDSKKKLNIFFYHEK